MAEFLNASADFNDTNNWTGGAVPSDATDFVNAGAQDLTTNNDWSATDTVDVRIGEQHAGQIGTSGAPWITGTGWTFNIDGRRMPALYVETGTGDTVTSAKVHSTSVNGVYWSGAGTITDLYVVEGTVRLSGTLTVTTIHVLGPDATVIISGDHTITTIHQQAGKVECASDVTVVNIAGGEFDLIGDGNTEGDVTTVTQSGGVFYFSAPGRTISNVNGRGGRFDCSRVSAARTITTANIWAGHTAVLDDGTDNMTVSTLNKYGGAVTAGASVTVTNTVDVPTPRIR